MIPRRLRINQIASSTPSLDGRFGRDVVPVSEAFSEIVDCPTEGLELLQDWVVEFCMGGFAAEG